MHFHNAAMLLLALVTAPVHTAPEGNARRAPNTIRGFGVGYRAGLMEKVAANRGMAQVNCMVASSYFRLGQWVTVKGINTGRTATCRVTDVTAPRHIALVRRRGIVVEFGYQNMPAMCGFRTGREPARACPVTIYH